MEMFNSPMNHLSALLVYKKAKKALIKPLGAIFILRKDTGVGEWSRKWQFPLTLSSKNAMHTLK